MNRELIHAFVAALPLPQTEIDRLLALTPAGYVGLAAQLAQRIGEQGS